MWRRFAYYHGNKRFFKAFRDRFSLFATVILKIDAERKKRVEPPNNQRIQPVFLYWQAKVLLTFIFTFIR